MKKMEQYVGGGGIKFKGSKNGKKTKCLSKSTFTITTSKVDPEKI